MVGGSSGIGDATARELQARGARVVALARRFSASSGRPLPEPGQRVDLQLDACDPSAVTARFAELGALDALILSMGLGYFAPVLDTPPSALHELLRVHVEGTLLCCQAALPAMKRAGKGILVSVGSLASRETFADCGAYAAAKAAQAILLRVLADELRPHGVRVTQLLAGAVDTALWDSREGFEPGEMLDPAQVAAILCDVVARPAAHVEELVVMPPAGRLQPVR